MGSSKSIVKSVAIIAAFALIPSCTVSSKEGGDPTKTTKRVPNEELCRGLFGDEGATALKRLTRSPEGIPEPVAGPADTKKIASAMRQQASKRERGESRHPLCSFRAPPSGGHSDLVTLTFGWSSIPRKKESENFNYFTGKGSLIVLNLFDMENSLYFPCQAGDHSGIVKANLNDSWTGVKSLVDSATAYADVLHAVSQKMSRGLGCNNKNAIPSGSDVSYLGADWQRLSDDRIPKALLDVES